MEQIAEVGFHCGIDILNKNIGEVEAASYVIAVLWH